MAEIIQWIDLIWLPVTLFVVHKKQRLPALGFLISGIIMLRLQVDLMHSTGYTTGILPFMTSDLMTRGLATYSIFYTLYLALAYYSPNTNPHVFMAASLSIFFAALFTSMIVMLL